MKKILYTATSNIHLYTFHIPYLKWLKEQGYQVDIAVEKRNDLQIPYINNYYNLPFPRSIVNGQNLYTYRKLKAIIDNGNYDLIHCHTPIPSLITRLAAKRARKRGTKVLYTAHGFHFYKGAPLKYWIIYYVAEWFLSMFTDGIITINREDFNYINGRWMHKDSFYLKGIGIDTEKFRNISKQERSRFRTDLGYRDDQFILLYIAEFIYRKNHQFIIDCLPELSKAIPALKVLFAGRGVLQQAMEQRAKDLGVSEVVDFLGFRIDTGRIGAIADVGISSSRQEGLGLGLAEEMLCSLPIVASEDRGHKEMMEHGSNGFMFGQGDKVAFINYITLLYNDPILRKDMGQKAYAKAQVFTIVNSLETMKKIYRQYL